MGTSGFRTLPVRSIVLTTLILFALLQIISCGHKRSHNSSDVAGVSPTPAASQATSKQLDLAATLAEIDAAPTPRAGWRQAAMPLTRGRMRTHIRLHLLRRLFRRSR